MVEIYESEIFIQSNLGETGLVLRKTDMKALPLDYWGMHFLTSLRNGLSSDDIAHNVQKEIDIEYTKVHSDVKKFFSYLDHLDFLEPLINSCWSKQELNEDNHVPLLFHCATALIEEEAVIFAGDGGIGKSTLAENLETHGYTVLGDEVACVYPIGDKWSITSTYKMHSDGSYRHLHPVNSIQLGLVVFLRSHLPVRYKITDCSNAEAALFSFKRLFCSKIQDPEILIKSFRSVCSIFSQTPALYLDFAKNIEFMPSISERIKGENK